MPNLSQNEIHLWFAYYDRVDDAKIHDVYWAILSESERQQVSRFYFPRDRRRYLLTRALVRTVLSTYVSVRPQDWLFSANAYGRPEVTNARESGAQLSFNISHTHSLIVLGITKGRALGVDVENVRTRNISIDIADQFFSPTEVATLSAVPPTEQRDRFFEYWTFKESYIKARGMGLSIPLDKFSFRFPHDGAVELAIDPSLEDRSERWQFWQFRPTSEYLVAVCAERTDTQSPSIVVREAILTEDEKLLSIAVSRASDRSS
jgi:4'-phosphopantetheinyl transferase